MKQCKTCALVTYLQHPNKTREWWECTYRPPATMRVLDVDGPIQIGDEPLRAHVSEWDAEVKADDWCDQWRARTGPVANLRQDGVFMRYDADGIAQPIGEDLHQGSREG